MGKGNGKTDTRNLDVEHELPPAEGGEERPDPTPLDSSASSEIDKVRAERDALLDRLARLQAEFDNARKRAVREQQDFREFAAADVIKSILPVLDSFERALKTPSSGSNADDLRGGLELIYRQFQDALQKLGVQSIEAVGKPFDPRVHEAVEMVETKDVEDHQVLDEFQRGYNYKGRMLRPAMVRVAKNSD
ncbi:MAG: nucleotide exchange factor GrpE [Acidobacteria bacterium]|nr:nucleotide exchange factor GrpE [Acidobacteriota bacterium]